MSATLNTVAAELFDSAVKQAYQDSSKLRNTVYSKSAKDANNIKFRSIGKGVASARGAASSDVVPMGITHNLIPCPTSDYIAPEYTDIFGDSVVNFSETNELAEVIASAIGRTSDQLILDALSLTTTAPIGSGALTVDTLTAAKEAMDKKGVPTSDRYVVIEAKGLSDLLNETKITSSDYNSVKALVQGDVDTFLGFKFIMLADRAEGGIANNGINFTGYAYHKRAIGYGAGLETKTKVDWVPQKLSWLSIGMIRAGSVIIDNDGIIPINYAV